MRGYSIMSDEERQNIISQHKSFYNGYAVGNVPSNMTPLTVYDAAQDKGGVNVNNRGEVNTYKNHLVNESTITEKKKDDKWIQDIDMKKGALTSYCKGKVTCGCVEEALKDKKHKKQAQLYLNMNSDKCKSLQESKLKEIEADDMDVSDVESAYDFDSKGPEQFDHSYSDDSYDLDLDAIMQMFGDSDDMDDEIDMDRYNDEIDMDKEFDGHEMMRGERRAYDFDSDGGNVDVYGESKMSEKERAWEDFLELNPSINSETIKGARKHFEDMWSKTNSDVNEEEETEAMCEQCGLSEAMCECGMYEEMDSDLHESFKTQKDRITEMFNRFKNYN